MRCIVAQQHDEEGNIIVITISQEKICIIQASYTCYKYWLVKQCDLMDDVVSCSRVLLKVEKWCWPVRLLLGTPYDICQHGWGDRKCSIEGWFLQMRLQLAILLWPVSIAVLWLAKLSSASSCTIACIKLGIFLHKPSSQRCWQERKSVIPILLTVWGCIFFFVQRKNALVWACHGKDWIESLSLWEEHWRVRVALYYGYASVRFSSGTSGSQIHQIYSTCITSMWSV